MLGPMTFGALSSGAAAVAWTPASATDDGGVSPHTWHYAGSGALYTDAGVTPVASDGDVVGRSVSQGSDSHTIDQATLANKPLYKTNILNGEPVFRYDGDDSLFGTYSAALVQPAIRFGVAKMTGGADNNTAYFLWDGLSAGGRLIAAKESSVAPDAFAIYAGAWIYAADADNDWHIWAALYNGASSELWLDGVSVATGNPGASGVAGLALGSNKEPASVWWLGDIAEFVEYGSNLSNADINQIGNYLATKYGLSWTNLV